MANGKHLLKFIPHVVGVTLALAFFLNYHNRARNVVMETLTEYPLLSKDDQLSSEVKEIYCPREVRCATPPFFIEFENGLKKSINAEASVDGRSNLFDLLSVGDSVVKLPKSDTLILYDAGEPVPFLINAMTYIE